MCGIAGFFDGKGFERERSLAVLQSMNRRLRHRGPDDEGTFVSDKIALGMTRLSIVDLHTGHQPIFNEDNTLAVVANGEIYNAPDLRAPLEAKGHRLKTRSDVETIVHLYEDHGAGCFEKLSGMFAAALWDSRTQTLLLARDRLGIKPLFYALEGSRLTFGSEIKAILPALSERPRIRPQSLWDFLTLGYIPAPYTIYENVFKLPPGHYLRADANGRVVRPYWELKPAADPPRTIGDACERVYAAMKEAVRSHLMSDVPLGVLLSGGLDSSTLVALMTELGAPVKTFSLGFEEKSYNELPAARLIAKHFGAEHHEEVLTSVGAKMIIDLLPYFDEPFQDSSCIPMYLVSKLARRHVKVVLSGEGGDELFGGYFTYQADKIAGYYQWLPKILRHSVFPALANAIPATDGKLSFDYFAKKFVENAKGDMVERHVGWKALFTEEQKARLLAENRDPSPTVQMLREPLNRLHGELDPLNRLLYLDAKVYLPDDLLTKADRMSMAVSLEARVPFLDHRVVELAFSLPFSYKLRRFTKKYILKRMMKGKLPDEILKKRKGGFSIPLAKWLKEEPLRGVAAEALSDSELAKAGFFRPEPVRKIVRDHLDGKRDNSRQIWALLVFQLWHDAYSRERGAGELLPSGTI